MKKYQSPSWHKEGEKDGERGGEVTLVIEFLANGRKILQ